MIFEDYEKNRKNALDNHGKTNNNPLKELKKRLTDQQYTEELAKISEKKSKGNHFEGLIGMKIQ